jgi:hypothetical protein
MNDRLNNLFVLCIVSSIITGVFWFVYGSTENIVATTGVCISTVGILYMLSKRKNLNLN